MSMVAVGPCLTICNTIIVQLQAARQNKKETASLVSAVECIYSYLKSLPDGGLSEEGTFVLGKLGAALQDASKLVASIGNMGPLVALVMALHIRDEFLRVNRDLMNTFHMLASGENLRELSRGRAAQIQAVQSELGRAQATFFVEKERIGGKMKDITEEAQLKGTSAQLVQQQLRDQFQAVEELGELSQEELLAEMKQLQMAVLYGDGSGGSGYGGGGSGSAQDDMVAGGGFAELIRGGAGKKKKAVDSKAEEFLVQQVCAALAARAYKNGGAKGVELSPGPDIPRSFLCPIGCEIMARPVIIPETGHTFEEANILRWLSTNDTCPVTKRRLTSKLLTPNYGLRDIIEKWAEEHGVALQGPAERVALPEAAGGVPAAASASFAPPAVVEARTWRQQPDGHAAIAAEAVPTAHPHPGSASYLSKWPDAAAHSPGALGAAALGGAAVVTVQGLDLEAGMPIGMGKHNGGDGGGSGFRCTRTRWAALLIATALVVAAAVAGGVVVAGRRGGAKAGASPSLPNNTTAASPSLPNNSTATTWDRALKLGATKQVETPWGVTWYYFDSPVEARSAAAQTCSRLPGGRLATVDTTQKAELLARQVLTPFDVDKAWVGLSAAPLASAGASAPESASSRVWEWDSGAAASPAGLWSTTYEGKPGATVPDGWGTIKDVSIPWNQRSCVVAAGPNFVMGPVGSLDDVQCSATATFVCEVPDA